MTVDDVASGDMMKREEDDVIRGRRLHRPSLQPTVDEEQTATTSQRPAVCRHRRQRSISFDACVSHTTPLSACHGRVYVYTSLQE